MTRKELSQIYYLNRELERFERALNGIISESTLKSPTISDMPKGSGGMTRSQVEETAIKIAEFREFADVYRQNIQNKKMEVEAWIESLDDYYLKQIVHYRCVELMSWTKVAWMMGGGNTADGCRKYFERKVPK